MATPDILLTKIEVPLDGAEVPHRLIYGFPEFVSWLRDEVPRLERGRLGAADSPNEQLDAILYKWTSGKYIYYRRMFFDLTPRDDEVWEMKTADLRIFGWIWRPRIFIAVFGDYADLYKGRSPSASYEIAKRRVLAARQQIDLDEPKFAAGGFDELVCV